MSPAGRAAGTSPLAGYTRSLQLVRISPTIMMVDTAGVSPIDTFPFHTKVFLGAVPVEKVDDPLMIFEDFMKRIQENYYQGFEEHYRVKLDSFESYDDLLEQLAIKRGRIQKGGVPDIEETARIIIRDFQIGKFPYWEIPPHMKGELDDDAS